ncbi:MAG: bifunctional nuclease family protein [Candidatus Aenigmarchaeota archaeon]|nr:bifunctional nuclease family protein [Candidatus Aenigmarchaeota archaeon]
MIWYTRSRRKRRLMYSLTIIILILIAISIYSLYGYVQTRKIFATEGFIEMRLEKVISVDKLAVVQLKSDCSELSFYISPDQASAISEGISNVTKFRPMTHDTFVNVLEGFDVKPIMVKITKLSENTYYAELTLQRGNRFLIVDSRPSDAIALAVRTNVPIYVNESLTTKVC